MEECIHRYETYHAKFGEKLFAKATRYVRRYVQPEPNPLIGAVVELDFDVICASQNNPAFTVLEYDSELCST